MPASSSDTSKCSKEIHRQGFALGKKILLMVSQNIFFSSTGAKKQREVEAEEPHKQRTWKLKGKRGVSAQPGGRWLQMLTGFRSTSGSSVLPEWINKSESPKHLKQPLLKEITCKRLKIWLTIKIKRGNINTESYSVCTKMSPALQVTGNTLFALQQPRTVQDTEFKYISIQITYLFPSPPAAFKRFILNLQHWRVFLLWFLIHWHHKDL